jgi:ABC-type dipeptide/oligopeptide/nickel transport system permease subunit
VKKQTATMDGRAAHRAESPWRQARRRFFAGRQGPLGLLILGIVFAFVIIGPIFAPFRYGEIPTPSEEVFLGRAPSLEHIFGETAQLQLDVFTLVVNGGRASLLIGFIAAFGSITIGTLVGIMAGYFGGRLDSFLMRLTDVFLAIPSLFVIIVGARILSALGGTGLQTVIIVFVVFGWMGTARLVRGQVLALREMEFIEAARALGVRPIRIALRHVLPNAIGPVVVSFPFAVGGAIIGEAFISFLGFGVSPLTPTWGNMLSNAEDFLLQGNWWWLFFPGLFIVMTSLSVNMIGDALRDSLEPEGRRS